MESFPASAFALLFPRALAAKHGIRVHTTDPVICRQKLYAVRRELGATSVSILQSPSSPNELWLCHTAPRGRAA